MPLNDNFIIVYTICKMICKSFIIQVLFLSMLFLSGCAVRHHEPCIKDGKEYCITDEWIFSENWYSCYLRGISCSQGGCWENARDEFLFAIHKREGDERWVKTYGMHRLPEYFPSRELGISLYHLNELDSALKYLLISLEQCESAKAKYYLNKVRKEKLLQSQEDKESPQLMLDPYPQIIGTPNIIFSGMGRDDTFVSNILIKINDQQDISLMEVSQPHYQKFCQKFLLKSEINNISIKVTDLLGKKDEKTFKILVDQEGPMIYFTTPISNDVHSTDFVQGVICDVSDVSHFYFNEVPVKLNRIEKSPCPAYFFSYSVSIKDFETGCLTYQAEDSLKNITFGKITLKTVHEKSENKGVQIAMASRTLITDSEIYPLQNQNRRDIDSIKINVSKTPEETFQDEICPQITIISNSRIKEVIVDGSSILSAYGIKWSNFFELIIQKYLDGKGSGRLLFNRMIKLKEGKNIIDIKVVDFSGKTWEKQLQIVKKTKQIHKLKERWKIAVPPFFTSAQFGNDEYKKGDELTYLLIEAFINQERFKVVDFENLPIIINENRLCHYLGNPLLGLPSDSRLWIDTFILSYIQQTEDSLTLSSSMVDLETGEILATKDVCEEINYLGLNWDDALKEHTLHLCLVLAAKFKEHFPLCEGNVISLKNKQLKTSICENDGLKQGMKLILYRGDLASEENYTILADASVKEVKNQYSLANIIKGIENLKFNENISNLGVITR